MTLRTLMLAGPAKAVELFTRLAATSGNALKTRERLFTELKATLEQHVDLEERHLFPILRKQAETKELVTTAIRDNKDLRAQLGELDALPKNDETFLDKLTELQKGFRQHARDEKRELLPAVQAALSEEQVQDVVVKMETTLAEADQARLGQAEEKRVAARREREAQEQVELQVQQEQKAEQERQEATRRTQKAARAATEAAAQVTEAAVEAVAEQTQQVARTVTEGAQRAVERVVEVVGETAGRTAAVASAMPRTGFFFWDMMLGLPATPSSHAVATREASVPASRQSHGNEEVIPLAEEVLVVGKRTVNTGTTRIRRYVVETPVEQQVSLVRERVVVERRRPATNKVTGEVLTELTIEVVETDEVPVVAKSVQLREEIVVRTERTEHMETVRETVRQDEVEIEHADVRRPARARG